MLSHWKPPSVFDAVSRHLPDVLVPAPKRDLCRAVAASLPAATLSYYLECRLDDDAQVDFLTLTEDRRAAELFRGSLAERAGAEPWRRTLSLMDDWQRASELADVPLLWLEYDIDRHFQRGGPLASPGLCVETDYLSRSSRVPAPDRARARALARGGLRRLMPERDYERAAAAVATCVDALPDGGSLIHISAMVARRPVETKLYLALPKQHLGSYLERVSWPGSVSRVRELMQGAYDRIGDTVFVDLALRERVEAKLGLAYSQFHRSEIRDFDPAWRWLSMPDTCPTKRAALRDWPGVEELRVDGIRTWVHRWLDLKLVLDSQGGARYKAYLGYMASLPPPFA